MRFWFSLPVTDPNAQESKQWPQVLAVLAASLCGVSAGMHYAWPSPALPVILSDDFPLNISSEETSYIALVAPLGDLIGAPIAGCLADIIGRKNSILFSALPTLIAWMIIAFANSTWMFCIGRIFAGIADGFFYIIFPMYMGETTEPSIRGVIGGSLPLSLMMGALLINGYVPFLSIRDSSIISAVIPVLLILCFAWMPESPYYLIMKGKMEEAKKALYFLRRCNVDKDLEVLKSDVRRQMSERGTLKDVFHIRSNRKAFFIVIGIRIVQQFSGLTAWSMYTQTIFAQAGADLSPVLASCIYSLTQLFTICWCSLLLDKYGRRPLLILSCLLCGIILIIGGVYFYLQQNTALDISSFTWIPITVMLAYVVCFCVGLGTVPSVILGEMFSTSVKGKALCIICMIYSLVMSGTSKLFHFMTITSGLYSPFFFFGVMCLLGMIFSYYVLPETKGKTLEEIQQNLKGIDNQAFELESTEKQINNTRL